jgi:hypothetical protein
MGRTACTGPQCLYKCALYLYLTVELYLYSPYWPYGLYRASVPVQGWTLPFNFTKVGDDAALQHIGLVSGHCCLSTVQRALGVLYDEKNRLMLLSLSSA